VLGSCSTPGVSIFEPDTVVRTCSPTSQEIGLEESFESRTWRPAFMGTAYAQYLQDPGFDPQHHTYKKKKF
jgi:hypothetical protein